MASTPNAQSDLYSDGFEPVTRAFAHEVFFLSIEACPEPGTDQFGSIGGAYIHCYLNVDSLREAEAKAIALVQERGWRPHRLEGWEITSTRTANLAVRDDFGHCQLDLIRIALAKGHALAFYTWEIDAR